MNSQIIIDTDLLVFVVGTSGSGKDSVMREAVSYLNSQSIPASTLKRVITRTPDKNEDSIFMTVDDFLNRKKNNEFALSWHIYDNWYGCGWPPIKNAINQRQILLINVSRNILFKARKVFPNCLIILVTVPVEIAESRIKRRGREDEKGLQTRMSRMKNKIEIPSPNLTLKNTGNLNKTAEELGNFLKNHYLSRWG
ncbi:MAG: hypothetical protein ACW97Z_03715 [Candidatus Hodarchaeales archaeon]|jgi:ribose 1,5-bisphosphokinase